jgi:hypothetical protein
MSGVPIGVDETDHIAFFCPQCDRVLTVTSVVTKRVLVNANTGNKDKCTWVRLHCSSCRVGDQRKFYWTTERGEYCDERTDHSEHSGNGDHA